jgi:hypothetical protein
MGSCWKNSRVPHRAWNCIDVIDLGGDGAVLDESDYATCEMCGNEKIRYIHTMEHPNVSESFNVGCICAEKMSEDCINPKKREKVLKQRASRKARCLLRKWRTSAKENSFLNVADYNLVVYPNKSKRNFWGYRITQRSCEFSDSERSPREYETENEAKLALFDDFWIKLKKGLA